MNNWDKWIREMAYDHIDQIERHLNASPSAFPEFAEVARKIDAAMEETDEHPDVQLTERDDLWMTYSAALALEMYLAGTRDGGRVYHHHQVGFTFCQKHGGYPYYHPKTEGAWCGGLL